MPAEDDNTPCVPENGRKWGPDADTDKQVMFSDAYRLTGCRGRQGAKPDNYSKQGDKNIQLDSRKPQVDNLGQDRQKKLP